VSIAGITLHAGCVVIGEKAVLLTGKSGAGKSSLARALVDTAVAEGRFAAMVADDRVLISRHGDRLVARPHPRLARRPEIRGFGIVRGPFEPAAVIALVLELSAGRQPRMPEATGETAHLLGMSVPSLRLYGNRPVAENAAITRIRLRTATVF